MIFELTGNNVVIAGGSGLIGKALVDGFRKVDANVVNADIRHGDVYFNQSDASSIPNLFQNGCPDVFINATYPRDLKTHTEAWLAVTQAVINKMLQERVSGSIINFASIYGVRPPDYSMYENINMTVPYVEYTMAKASIIAMTWFLANKYKHNDIRINAISPGGVWNHQDRTFVKRYETKGKMLDPKDLFGPVCFLACSASNHITGQNLIVDGGWTL